MAILAITALQLNELTYTGGKVLTINPDFIKMLTSVSTGTQIQYYNDQHAKLDVITTSTNVNTILAAMSLPKLVNLQKIDAATFKRPAVLNQTAWLTQTGSFLGYAVTVASVTNKTFTVAGSHATEFKFGQKINVSGSTSNDGEYTVSRAVLAAGPTTVITVQEAVPTTTADGVLNYTTQELSYNLGRFQTQRPKDILLYINSLSLNSGSGRAITAVSQANKTFTYAGSNLADWTNGYYGQPIRVSGSTGNDKLYSIVKVNIVSGATVVTVAQTIPDSTADGTILT